MNKVELVFEKLSKLQKLKNLDTKSMSDKELMDVMRGNVDYRAKEPFSRFGIPFTAGGIIGGAIGASNLVKKRHKAMALAGGAALGLAGNYAFTGIVRKEAKGLQKSPYYNQALKMQLKQTRANEK